MRTFRLLLLMLALTGCLAAMLLDRVQELYKEQDATQNNSVLSLAVDIVNERIDSKLKILGEAARFPFSPNETDTYFLKSIAEKFADNEKLKRRIGCVGFILTDINGNLVTPHAKTAFPAANLSSYDFIYRALRGFHAASDVVEAVPGSGTKRHCILLSAPIYIGATNVGSLSAVLPLGPTVKILGEIELPYTGASLFILDSSNRIVASRLAKDSEDTSFNTHDGVDIFGAMHKILTRDEEDGLKKAIAGSRIYGNSKVNLFDVESSRRSAAFAAIQSASGWTLFALSSDSGIRAAQQRMIARMGNTFLALTTLLMFIVLLVYFLSWRSKRTQQLSHLMMDSSGIYLFTLSPDGTASGFDRPLAALLGLPHDQTRFNINDYTGRDHRLFQNGIPDVGGSFRLRLNTPRGAIYILVRVIEKEEHGRTQVCCMDVTNDEMLRRRVENLAYKDRVTGLPNAESFRKMIYEVLEAKRGHSYQATCFFIEIKDSHKILEIFGVNLHKKMLTETARRLMQAGSRLGAQAYSLNYDNFCVYQQNSTAASITELTFALKETFRQPYKVGDNTFETGCYIGVASYEEYIRKSGITAEDIFGYGEVALRLAKTAPDNICRLDDATYKFMRERLDMELCLRDALAEHEMELYFQPIYNAIEDRIVSVEALSRWRSAKYGDVPPDKFIPMAELNGFINELGDWVIDEAIAFAEILAPYHISVEFNVSMIQLTQMDFIDKLLKKVKDAALPKHSLGMEITESYGLVDALGVDCAGIKNKIRPLKEAGIAIYIDDFGTGYSSLASLKDIDADYMKVDKSFVRGMTESKQRREILKAIAAMATALHLEVVVEGVELESELALLLEMGYTNIQGYLIAKPMSGEELLKFIKKFDLGAQ